MSDKNSKELRKQLRAVVKEIIPELVTEELSKAVYEAVAAEIKSRLSLIESNVKETMHEINNRSKDVQSYLVRSTTAGSPTNTSP